MSLNDLFGEHPDRPDNDTMKRLSDIVIRLDGQALENGATVRQLLGEEQADADAVAHLASQRVMRLNIFSNLGLTQRQQVSMMSLYIDAFTVGSRYAQKVTGRDPAEVLQALKDHQAAGWSHGNVTCLCKQTYTVEAFPLHQAEQVQK